MKNNKLDLKAIRASSNEASERIKQLPKWMQEAIQVVSHAAASEESRKCLYERYQALETAKRIAHSEVSEIDKAIRRIEHEYRKEK
jgi:multidrug resistance efflux pump